MAIVFGHEIRIFIPKFGQNSNFYSLKYCGGEGGLPVRELFLKKQFFGASLISYSTKPNCLDHPECPTLRSRKDGHGVSHHLIANLHLHLHHLISNQT